MSTMTLELAIKVAAEIRNNKIEPVVLAHALKSKIDRCLQRWDNCEALEAELIAHTPGTFLAFDMVKDLQMTPEEIQNYQSPCNQKAVAELFSGAVVSKETPQGEREYFVNVPLGS